MKNIGKILFKTTKIMLSVLLCVPFISCAYVDFDEEPLSNYGTPLWKPEEEWSEYIVADDIKPELYEKVKKEILKWNEEGIYAISFFVYSNEVYEYKGYNNVSIWEISYNTEKDCRGSGEHDEERWNYAFWRQNNVPIIDIDTPNEYTQLLFDWYEANGITNIGEEDFDNAYDEYGRYIGSGPVGEYELVRIASDVARRLQTEGIIKEHFGKEIPIIVHGLEYAWYNFEATEWANPNGEAKTFVEAMKKIGFN